MKNVACALVMLIVILVAPGGAATVDRQATPWRTAFAQIEKLYIEGRFEAAVAKAREVLDLARGPDEIGRSLDRLGFVLAMSGKLEEAEQHLREAVAVTSKAFGDDSPAYALPAHDLAIVLRDRGAFAEALPLAERALEIRRRTGSETDDLYLQTLNTLATVHAQAGNLREAIRYFEEALTLHEKVPADRRSTGEYGSLCVSLAQTYQRAGRYAAAAATFEKGLAAFLVVPGISHPVYPMTLAAMAALDGELGRYAQAEARFDQAEKLFVEQLGGNNPNYGLVLHNRGMLYQSIGNLERAERDYNASLAVKARTVGVQHFSNIATLRNLGMILARRDPAAGAVRLGQALALFEKTDSPLIYEHVTLLRDMAATERQLRAMDDARARLQKALAIASAGLGTGHQLYASVLGELGLVDAATGAGDTAERELREGLAIAERAYGASHSSLLRYILPLARLSTERGDLPSALSLYRRSVQIDHDFITSVLAVGSETFKRVSLSNATDLVPELLALDRRIGRDHPEAAAIAFEAATGRKGRLLEQVRSEWDQFRSGGTEAAFKEWQALLACRNSLSVALEYRPAKSPIAGECGLAGTSFAGQYERLLVEVRQQWSQAAAERALAATAALTERANVLETSLTRTRQAPAVSAMATAEAVSARLGDGTALVEYISYQGDTGESRYGAFVIYGRDVRWVDLAAAKAIDAAVGDFREAANDWSVATNRREARATKAAEATAEAVLARVSDAVLRPVMSFIEARPAIRTLRIAPDSALNLMPFEAFPIGARRLIDRFAVSYLSAGRDLLVDPLVSTAAGPPLLVVSPGGNLAARPGDRAGDSGAPVMPRLAYASREVADLQRLMPRATILERDQAAENHVKTLVSPSILHVVGHGIIRDAAVCLLDCASQAAAGSESAMIRSAILLEEAYGRSTLSGDDGFLTPAELQRLDLRGTEMLVLSQCRLASGEASIGDGIYGMRRAATLAGAHSFVAPLWNVDDRIQRLMMQRFYLELSKGRRRVDALRTAKLSVKQTAGTAGVFYWAPVILTGDPGRLPDSTWK